MLSVEEKNTLSRKLLVVSGPSGVGKTTCVRHLCEPFIDGEPFIELVSTTSRPIRDGETPGVDYHFVTRRDAESMRERGGFAEWDEYGGNIYGLTWQELRRVLDHRGVGGVVVMTPMGLQQLRERGLKPASVWLDHANDVLVGRMRSRGDAIDKIKARMALVDDQRRQALGVGYGFGWANFSVTTTTASLSGIAQAHGMKGSVRQTILSAMGESNA